MKPIPQVSLCTECGGPIPCVCAREFGWQPKPMKGWRSRAYLDFVRRLPCCVPECKGGPVEAAHFGGRGVGTKAHDFLAIPLCGEHHRDAHQFGKAWPYYDTVEHWQVQTMGAALASGLRF